MRWLMLLLLVTLAPAAQAAGPRVYKVLPQFLDVNGRASLTPSLYDRDAYQAIHRSGFRTTPADGSGRSHCSRK
jgi:hypothetical protein